VYTQGLLQKGPGLCHGVAGCVSTLLCAANALTGADAERVRADALHLLQSYIVLANQDSALFAKPDHPWSLYEGAAGMCAVLEEALEWIEIIVGDARPHEVRSGLVGYFL